MMQQLVLVVAFLCCSAMAVGNETCPVGSWGPDCLNACGQCYMKDEGATPTCDGVTGGCESGCMGGYTGPNCEQAVCNNCAAEFCLAPNFCGNCGSISKVSPNCEDIRLRGLLGALMAFITVTASISLCGFGSVWYKRRKNTAVSL